MDEEETARANTKVAVQAGRLCSRCGRPLSRYNKNDYCGPCETTDSRPADARADIAPPADLGARLRAARERRGMSLETLGGLCGVSGAYICMIETGKRRLDRYSMILSLANALRIPPSELAGGLGEIPGIRERPGSDVFPEAETGPAQLHAGARIKELRRERKLTQEGLAERSGLSAVMIAKIEQNSRTGTLATLNVIANALGVPVGDLLKADAKPANNYHDSETRSAASLPGAKRDQFTARRKAVGYSQEYLAELLRVDRSAIGRWESGETAPQPWIRPKLAKALKISLDELNDLLAPVEPASARLVPLDMTEDVTDYETGGTRSHAYSRVRAANHTLRKIRVEERRETRAEFAEAVTQKAHELGFKVQSSERYIARLEDGDVRYPHEPYRRALEALCGRPIAELGFIRIPRAQRKAASSPAESDTTEFAKNGIAAPDSQQAGDGSEDIVTASESIRLQMADVLATTMRPDIEYLAEIALQHAVDSVVTPPESMLRRMLSDYNHARALLSCRQPLTLVFHGGVGPGGAAAMRSAPELGR